MFEKLKGSLSRIKALTIKEFRNLWVDKRITNMLLFAPVVQLILFGYAVTLEVRNVRMVIYDKDQTQYSRELSMKFNNDSLVDIVTFVDNKKEMVKLIDNQKAVFALIIPEGFQGDLVSGQPTSVQFILDGRKSNSSQVFASYSTYMLQQFQADLNPQAPKIEIKARSWFNPNLEYRWSMVIALTAILSMVTALIITSLSLAQEKEFGTFDQTLVSPLQPVEILIGKTIPAIVFALVSTSSMMFMGAIAFGVPIISSVWTIYIVTTLFLLSIAAVGLFISSMCNSQQQAILGVFAFMVPALLISGFVAPIDSMPWIMRVIGHANPVTYYILLMKGLFLKGMPYYLIIRYCIPLVIISVVSLTFAGWFFKRRLD